MANVNEASVIQGIKMKKHNIFTVTTTENGMLTYKTSLSAVVDLFSMGGSVRSRSPKKVKALLRSSFQEDFDLTYKLIHYLRDAREGVGERKIYRLALEVLLEDYGSIGDINYIGEYGRWDDLVHVIRHIYHNTHPNNKKVLSYLRNNLQDIILDNNKRGLFCKWMPRKGRDAKIIRNLLNLDPREYRKFLAFSTNVVEQKMSENKWNSIEYSKVPSMASLRYSKAFFRHDADRYKEYLKDLKEGKTEGNLKVSTPHDIVRLLLADGNLEYAEMCWKQLPELYNSEDQRILPVIDVSGSMKTPVSGSIEAIDISVALGIYISERLKGIFKNKYITFSNKPCFCEFNETDNLVEKINTIKDSPWGFNTDIEKTFREILDLATKFKIEESEMPTHVIILTDMEFDSYNDKTVMQMIEEKYNESGYKMPKIIFWNLCSRQNNIPFNFLDKNVLMVSGFSANIMKDIFNIDVENPLDYIKSILSKNRYKDLKFLEYNV